MTTRTLEVHLEEQDSQSWFAMALSALSGTSGFGQYRFVARPVGDHTRTASPVFRSAPFPLLRFTEPDAVPEPHPETDMAERMANLDRDVVADGWHRLEMTGRHWWSRTYERSD